MVDNARLILDGAYAVHADGTVTRVRPARGARVGAACRPVVDRNGYHRVCLSINSKLRTYWLHRLVCEAFHGAPKDAQQANHIDGDKANNRADNLEWVTPKANIAHARATGLLRPEHAARPGEKNGSAKLTADSVRRIRERAANGESGSAIARDIGVTKSVVCKIITRKLWRHV